MKVYILWQYPNILGIYTDQKQAESEGDRLAKKNGLKKTLAYWVGLVWWTNNEITLCMEEMEANKSAILFVKEDN